MWRGSDDGLLDEDGRVAEGALGLAHARLDGLAQLGAVVDPAHAPTAAAGDGLDEERGRDGLGRREQRVDVGGRLDGLQGRHAGRARGRDGAGLVAGQGQHVGGGADEGDAGVGARLGQGGVLGQEAVARVDRVGAGPQRDGDDRLGVEVGPHRVPALADLVGLVGLEPVLGPAVLVREDRDRARADLVGRAERPDRDLAAVGHQHLGEHGGTLSSAPVSPVVTGPYAGHARTRHAHRPGDMIGGCRPAPAVVPSRPCSSPSPSVPPRAPGRGAPTTHGPGGPVLRGPAGGDRLRRAGRLLQRRAADHHHPLRPVGVRPLDRQLRGVPRRVAVGGVLPRRDLLGGRHRRPLAPPAAADRGHRAAAARGAVGGHRPGDAGHRRQRLRDLLLARQLWPRWRRLLPGLQQRLLRDAGRVESRVARVVGRSSSALPTPRSTSWATRRCCPPTTGAARCPCRPTSWRRRTSPSGSTTRCAPGRSPPARRTSTSTTRPRATTCAPARTPGSTGRRRGPASPRRSTRSSPGCGGWPSGVRRGHRRRGTRDRDGLPAARRRRPQRGRRRLSQAARCATSRRSPAGRSRAAWARGRGAPGSASSRARTGG